MATRDQKWQAYKDAVRLAEARLGSAGNEYNVVSSANLVKTLYGALCETIEKVEKDG